MEQPGQVAAGGKARNVAWDAALNESDVWGDSALIDAYDRAIFRVKEEIAQLRSTSDPSKKAEITKSRPIPENASPHRNQDEFLKKNNLGTKGVAVIPPMRMTWKEGDYCRAMYSGDGKMYEAQVKLVDHSINACLVRYFGYGNEEEVQVENMQPSEGRAARRKQLTEARAMRRSAEMARPSSSSIMPESESTPRGEDICHYCNQPFYRKSFSNIQNWSCTNAGPGDTPLVPPPPPFPLSLKSESDTEALSIMLISWYLSGYHTGFYHGSRP